jgi:hypothetical protein
MKVKLVSPAEEELEDAVRFHEKRRAGLGLEFLDAYEAAVARMQEKPEAWRLFSPGFRRCLFERFAFGLIYRQGTWTGHSQAGAGCNRSFQRKYGMDCHVY